MGQVQRPKRQCERALGALRLLPAVCLPLTLCLLLTACFGGASTPTPPPTLTPTPPPTLTPTPRAAITYVAIGASDAFGIGTTAPDQDNWPAVLASKLGTSVHLVNLGIPGATADVANRDEAPIALAARPDIITVFLGVNDLDDSVTLDTFRKQIQTLLSTLAAETPARIFVGNLPDLTLLPHFAGYSQAQLRRQVLDWNDAIASVAHATGAILVDLFDGWGELAQHPEYISSDGFHPSSIGAARLADVFATAISVFARGA